MIDNNSQSEKWDPKALKQNINICWIKFTGELYFFDTWHHKASKLLHKRSDESNYTTNNDK